MTWVYWKGKLWPWRKVSISPINTGLFFGENIFEAVPVYSGRPLFIREHLDRLEKGCHFLQWPVLSRSEFLKVIQLFTRKAHNADFIVRFNLVQELNGQLNPRAFFNYAPTLFATIRPVRAYSNSILPIRTKIGISQWRAADEKTIPNQFKISFYLTTRSVFRGHPEWGEILRMNADGDVVDGGLSTPMLLKGKKVFVPPLKLGGLESVTRMKIIKAIKDLGIAVIQKSWRVHEVFNNGEIFFVGSGFGVMSPTHLQGRRINVEYPLAIKLWQNYRKWIGK